MYCAYREPGRKDESGGEASRQLGIKKSSESVTLFSRYARRKNNAGSLKRQRLPGQGTGEAFRRTMHHGTDFDQGHLCTSLSFQFRRKLSDFMKLVAGYALLVSENTSSGFFLLTCWREKSFSCREGRTLGSGALKKPGQLFQSHSVPAAKETCSKHGFSGSRITKGSEVVLKT